jgi:protein PhnA
MIPQRRAQFLSGVRGTIVKGIRLTDNEEEVECKVEKVKGLVLRVEFLKKA